MMENILILVRTEGDFERAISLGRAAQKKFNVNFIFVGDFSPFFNEGIKNEFQRKIFFDSGFDIYDFSDFKYYSRILKKLCRGKKHSLSEIQSNPFHLINLFLFKILQLSMKINRNKIIESIFNKINPIYLFTDQSSTSLDYLPEQIRQKSKLKGIPVYIFSHGAAGGLHSEFSNPVFNPYDGYTVLACNTNETNPDFNNRIISGDPSTSYPYVHFINKYDYTNITFLNDRKYKIAFYIGGTIQSWTSTNAWKIQEEIIIDLSEQEDVAMILKLHPREANYMDLRMIERFSNLKIVRNEVDRSRITKWADFVVCNDHTSVIFEPMILGKKVVAIEGKHIPKYKDRHSPLKHSSVKHIKHSDEFDLYNIPNADPFDKVTNIIAWGGNGKIDLANQIVNTLQ